MARVRVPGVLQRFSITYFVVASTAAITAKYTDDSDNNNELKGYKTKIKDLTTHWARWIVAFVFLIVHTLIIFLLNVPGCPTGYLGPAGLHDGAKYPPECVGGATGYIDRVFFTSDHIYGNPTPKSVYGSAPFDPEGLLGSFTSVVQVFLGYQGGQIILSYNKHESRLKRFVVWGVVNGVLGLILCQGRLNDGWIPINKNLW